MASLPYVARVTRLIGPGRTTYFEVELWPSDRLPGQVPGVRVRIALQEDRDAPTDRVVQKARQLLASVLATTWSAAEPD